MSGYEMWNEFGNLYLLSGSYDQAVRSYSRAISLDENSARSYSNMAQAYVKMGKYTEAIALYQRGIELMTDDYDKAFSWHKLGRVYHHLKDDHRAMDAYKQADELSPDARASDDILCLVDRRPANMDVLSTIVETSGTSNLVEDNPSPFLEELTPWWFENQTVPEEEIIWYDSELLIAGEVETYGSVEGPVFIEPLTWDIASSFETDGVQADIHRLEVVQEDAGFNTNAVNINQAQGAETDKDSPPQSSVEAGASLDDVPAETSIELIVEQPEPEELKEILVDIDKFKGILEIDPRNAYAWDVLGGLYKRMGQFGDAIKSFHHAVSLDHRKASYFHHLGLVYAAEGRYDEAITEFEKVIEIDPAHSLAHATLGGYYRKKGLEELAQTHIEKARALLGEDENEYNQACMEAICGNSDRAFELLEIALKNKQTYITWARKDPDLDFIRSDPRFHTLFTEYATRLTQ